MRWVSSKSPGVQASRSGMTYDQLADALTKDSWKAAAHTASGRPCDVAGPSLVVELGADGGDRITKTWGR
ncbi:hypothetical protein ACFVZJ_38245 [Streptomyces sp. NPDC058322]|uniref:hypothetical protein n=1 Tax=unclassified Streptomyces TaxID=2593676 RepID=UPI0036EA4397